jgi:hypothetical protein
VTLYFSNKNTPAAGGTPEEEEEEEEAPDPQTGTCRQLAGYCQCQRPTQLAFSL